MAKYVIVRRYVPSADTYVFWACRELFFGLITHWLFCRATKEQCELSLKKYIETDKKTKVVKRIDTL